MIECNICEIETNEIIKCKQCGLFICHDCYIESENLCSDCFICQPCNGTGGKPLNCENIVYDDLYDSLQDDFTSDYANMESTPTSCNKLGCDGCKDKSPFEIDDKEIFDFEDVVTVGRKDLVRLIELASEQVKKDYDMLERVKNVKK